MPRYEFRCQECASGGAPSTFEVTRPMSASSEPANCPLGHHDTVRLLSAVAVTSGGGRSGPSAPPGGGCCGGGCGCG